jgi:hypothetical protein
MNSPDIKYENWFECLLLVRPKLLIVEHDDYFTVGAIDVRSLDNYDTFLKEMLEGTSVEKYGTDFLEQAVEYWLEERDKIVAELKDAERDNPKSINLVREILYYDRAIKISIDEYLKTANENQEKRKRLTLKDLPKPVVNWTPHHDMVVLSKFCEKLTPEVSENYLRECFQKEKDDETAPAIIIEDTKDALWAIADDMRLRKENGEFLTYMAAYRWAAKHMTQNGKRFKTESLVNEWHKAKAKGLVD